MGNPLQIAVIADDFTGGADTGVLFCSAVGPVYLAGINDIADMQTGGIVVCTNSRHLLPAAAANATRKAAAAIRAMHPGLVYKKIDSCLRGNPGTEIDTLLQELGASLSFIAPALPSQGRTTENNTHKVHGVPVAETEAARDPQKPVTTSRLSERIASETRLPVGHLGLDILEQGVETAARRIRMLQQKGCAHIVFDAVTENHLDLIATVKQKPFRGEKILLAGSAGLAQALVRTMVIGDRLPAVPARPRIQKWLFVCGSASLITREQVDALAASSSWPHLKMDASFLAAPHNISLQQREVELVVEKWQQSNLILSIAPVKEDETAKQDPARVIAGLAGITALLAGKATPQGIFMSGGDTVEAILHQTGARGLLLLEEILPGLMLGRIQGGMCDKIPVVTKAGAFGNRDTLQQLIETMT